MRNPVVLGPMALLLLLCSCASGRDYSTMSEDQLRAAHYEPMPDCAKRHMRCDAAGDKCEVQNMVEWPSGQFSYWDKCKDDYQAWRDRIRDAAQVLLKLDPIPTCGNGLSPKTIREAGADPDSREWPFLMIGAGYMVASPACMTQLCDWSARNLKDMPTILKRCADFRRIDSPPS